MLKKEVDYEPLSPEKPMLGVSSTSNSTSSNVSNGRVVPSTPLPKSTTTSTTTPGHVKSKSTSVLGGGRPSSGGTLSRQRESRKDIRESLGREAGKGYVKATRLHSAESVRGESGFKASFLEGRGLPSSMLSPVKADAPRGSSPEKGKARDRRGEEEREREKKTTEEKKQLLGTMLGNVDALVEGVRKAGIWGLA